MLSEGMKYGGRFASETLSPIILLRSKFTAQDF